MATIKDYENLTKKLATTPEHKFEDRRELAAQKRSVRNELQAKAAQITDTAKRRAALRGIKSATDEINNS